MTDTEGTGSQPTPPVRQAKVVTVSDGVVAGTREDLSGAALEQALTQSGFEVVERSAIADGVSAVAGELARTSAGFHGLVVTTGGTGFSPHDQTPEGTREILERQAPGLAEAMRLVNPLGRLSRGVAGIRGASIILNTPGSPAGAVECLQAVVDVLPHALDLLGDGVTRHPTNPVTESEDAAWMAEAIALGQGVRTRTSPNPWVGAVVVPEGDEPAAEGATEPPGGPHAEAVAVELAGPSARGATLYTTLEPCSHHGRTPPCVDAIIAAGVRRVVIGVEDPDPHVQGQGIQRLRDAGIEIEVGVQQAAVTRSLAPYLAHRRRGTPWVVLKLAATLDGAIAAPDGSSQWITGPGARIDAHQLRAESDAILVGAGTVRADDPALTVREVEGRDPLRVILGTTTPPEARALPALVHEGPLQPLLEELGRRGVIQLLVEGGAHVAGNFHREGLVDQYVLYYAPALQGGQDGVPLFAGPGAPTMGDLWRGRISEIRPIGPDVRIDLVVEGSPLAVP